ncbi:ACT domain-containing protein [Rhizobium cauense]|uniref:ACT domain-containing protein n=1 Tax=Rhizobium cauense TaxID=1166683 RepID=UPI001C6EFAEC|nr:ACT domain-containing protein [Rhizobium cauense]MBW9114919.1 ACT domain-containing protein [Rhizobium cauense]
MGEQAVRGTQAMLSGMTPSLADDEFVFCTTTDEAMARRVAPDALGWFREREGTSLILPKSQAAELGFNCDVPMRRIVLQVFSSLEGVGLTAAVSAALAAHSIPCNMVAAYHHDHVFVPASMAEAALEILRQLQEASSS